MPTVHSKIVKMKKIFPSLTPSLHWLGDGHKNFSISTFLAKVLRVKVRRFKKWRKSAATRPKKVEIKKNFLGPLGPLAVALSVSL